VTFCYSSTHEPHTAPETSFARRCNAAERRLANAIAGLGDIFLRSVAASSFPTIDMKTETLIPVRNHRSRDYVAPAPSLRVPVTRKNRALLRWLRSAELRAWQDADTHPRRPTHAVETSFSSDTFFSPQMKSL
jgi:hypothetical protein